MLRLAIAALVVIGCSSRPHDTTIGNAGPPVDAAVPRGADPLPAGCPATFTAASGSCSTGDECAYPEGDCSCSSPPSCVGVNMPPGPPVWQCTPIVRSDGCPGTEPGDGTPCTKEGKSCDYTFSCVAAATCTKGVWVTLR